MVPYEPKARSTSSDLTSQVIAAPTMLTSDHSLRRRSSGRSGGGSAASASLRAHMVRRLCAAKVMFLSGLLLALLGLATCTFVVARFSAEIDQAATAGAKLPLATAKSAPNHTAAAAVAATSPSAKATTNTPLTLRRNATLALLAFQHTQAPLDAAEAGRVPLSLSLPAVGGARYWVLALALATAVLGGAGMHAANAAAAEGSAAAERQAERAHGRLAPLAAAGCALAAAVWMVAADAIRHGTAAAAAEGLHGISGRTASFLDGLGDMGRVGLLMLGLLLVLLVHVGAALRLAGLRVVAPPLLEALCALYAVLGGVLVLLATYALKYASFPTSADGADGADGGGGRSIAYAALAVGALVALVSLQGAYALGYGGGSGAAAAKARNLRSAAAIVSARASSTRLKRLAVSLTLLAAGSAVIGGATLTESAHLGRLVQRECVRSSLSPCSLLLAAR